MVIAWLVIKDTMTFSFTCVAKLYDIAVGCNGAHRVPDIGADARIFTRYEEVVARTNCETGIIKM